MLADHVYIMFSQRGSLSWSSLSSTILVEITEPEILVNRTEMKREHAQTFSSFDDFLNEDDGDYKSPGKEDCSTSDSECISGDEYEEDDFNRIQEIRDVEVCEGLILPENDPLARERTFQLVALSFASFFSKINN